MISPDEGLTQYFSKIKKTDLKKLQKREIEDKESLLAKRK